LSCVDSDQDPLDTSQLDVEGSAGAIGRFEASSQGLSCWIQRLPIPRNDTCRSDRHGFKSCRSAKLKVEAITNEFVTLSKVTNVMAKLNAVHAFEERWMMDTK
jgi:hypothetical protein